MKYLLALALTCCASAQAGTVYRDRPVPFPVSVSSQPCFITFKGWRINTSMISTFAVETVSWTERDAAQSGAFSSVWVNKSYEAFIVRLATGAKLEEREGDLPKHVEAFHALIKACK